MHNLKIVFCSPPFLKVRLFVQSPRSRRVSVALRWRRVQTEVVNVERRMSRAIFYQNNMTKTLKAFQKSISLPRQRQLEFSRAAEFRVASVTVDYLPMFVSRRSRDAETSTA